MKKLKVKQSFDNPREQRMSDEIFRLRRTVLSFVPDRYRAALNPPETFTRDGWFDWDTVVVKKLIELVETDEAIEVFDNDRVRCPLCGGVPQNFGATGFSVPTGLERHLLTSHNARGCDVMYVVEKLHRERYLENYPDQANEFDYE